MDNKKIITKIDDLIDLRNQNFDNIKKLKSAVDYKNCDFYIKKDNIEYSLIDKKLKKLLVKGRKHVIGRYLIKNDIDIDKVYDVELLNIKADKPHLKKVNDLIDKLEKLEDEQKDNLLKLKKSIELKKCNYYINKFKYDDKSFGLFDKNNPNKELYKGNIKSIYKYIKDNNIDINDVCRLDSINL